MPSFAFSVPKLKALTVSLTLSLSSTACYANHPTNTTVVPPEPDHSSGTVSELWRQRNLGDPEGQDGDEVSLHAEDEQASSQTEDLWLTVPVESNDSTIPANSSNTSLQLPPSESEAPLPDTRPPTANRPLDGNNEDPVGF